MRIYSYKDFHWEKSKLFFNDLLIAEIIPATTETTGWHPGYITGWKGFFHIKWPDGEISDVYNLTRAKDNAVKEVLRRYNAQETPTEGHGLVIHS